MNRSFRAAAVCGPCLSMLMLAARVMAADEFPVSDAQMRSLGITLQRLEKPREIAGLTYPAHVTLPPSAEHVVSAPVEGMVSQLLIEESETAKPGQALLRFDSPAFGALQLDLLEAAAADRLAQQALTRARQLVAEGVVAQRRVDEAEAAAGNARAQLAHSKAALRLAGADDASIERLASSGTVLDGLVIRAKHAATVLRIEVKPGQRVAAGDVLMRIGDVRQLWLEIQIPAERARRMQPGAPISVVGRDASAKALSVAATVSDSQTITLRAAVDSGAEHLRPGEFVQAMVPFADSGSAWALPLGAVARRDEKAFVFVRTAQGFAARPVTVAASAGQSISVEGPLKSGDAVAVSGVIALKGAWLGESGGN